MVICLCVYYVCVRVCVRISAFMCVYVCVYMCVYVCVWVCVCVYVCVRERESVCLSYSLVEERIMRSTPLLLFLPPIKNALQVNKETFL